MQAARVRCNGGLELEHLALVEATGQREALPQEARRGIGVWGVNTWRAKA